MRPYDKICFQLELYSLFLFLRDTELFISEDAASP